MDQTRVFRFLGQVETCRVVFLMVLVVAFVSGLQYFELTPISIVSPRNGTVSEFKESNNITNSAENETFLASQEASSGFEPRNSSTTEVLKSLEHKFLNDSPKSEPSGPSRGNDTASSLHSLQPQIPQKSKKHERSAKKQPLVVISISQMNNMILKRHSDPNNSLVWNCK